MGDVVDFKGEFYINEDNPQVNYVLPTLVLEQAIEADLDEVVVIGRTSEGALYFAGSHSDLTKIYVELDRVKDFIRNANFTHS